MALIPFISSIVFLVLFLAAIIAGLVIFFKIRNKAREISRDLYGNDNLIQNLKKNEQDKEYLMAIDTRDASKLQDGNEELKEALFLRLNDLNLRDIKEHYQGIKIHNTVLNTYNKFPGRCVVRFQSSLQYTFWAEDDEGKVIRGRKDALEQTRYSIDCCYIQDSDKIENIAAAGHALNCPNCGGAITNLGVKTCPYCGSVVTEFNIKVWNFCAIKESV